MDPNIAPQPAEQGGLSYGTATPFRYIHKSTIGRLPAISENPDECDVLQVLTAAPQGGARPISPMSSLIAMPNGRGLEETSWFPSILPPLFSPLQPGEEFHTDVSYIPMDWEEELEIFEDPRQWEVLEVCENPVEIAGWTAVLWE